MGEIADQMLDGTMCQVCGEWMPDFITFLEVNSDENGVVTKEWDPPGYPQTCTGCS